jgi:hypothetical protein
MPHLKILVTILLFGATFTAAQSKGSISGSVTDGFGAIIPEVKITLVRMEKGGERVVGKIKSAFEGKFQFGNLEPGSYEVRVEWQGLQGVDRTFRKKIDLTRTKPVRDSVAIPLAACTEADGEENAPAITQEDKAEIVREMFRLQFEPFVPAEKIAIVPWNMEVSWLTPDQRSHIHDTWRDQVQALTGKQDYFTYYSITPLEQRGGCVSGSMLEHSAVKGQMEDANMSGGGTIYEFRKIDGHWIGQAFSRWIS